MNWQRGDLKYSDPSIGFDIDNQTYTFNGPLSGETVTMKYRLKYLEIPFGLKLKTHEIGYLTYFTKFGLNAAFNLSAMGDANQKSIEDADFNNEINFINFGYHLGFGLEYSLWSDFILSGGLTYYQGIGDVTTNSDYRENDKIILSNVRLSIGVYF